MFRGKLLGKFGLVRNPLVPVRSSPHSPAKQNSYDWPHGERVILTVNILSKFIFCLFHNLLKKKHYGTDPGFFKDRHNQTKFCIYERANRFIFTKNDDHKIAVIDPMLVFSNQVYHAPKLKHAAFSLKPN